MGNENSAGTAHEPNREGLARLVICGTGSLLALIIIGLFFLWYMASRDAVAIDVSKGLTGNDLKEQVEALNKVLETKAHLTTQATKDMTQLLLTAVLPLFGAWVGTVLAYFFSREGFEAASRAQLQLIKQLPLLERLRQFKVPDRMVKRPDMDVLRLTEAEVKDPASVSLSRLLAVLQKPKRTRLPILGPEDRFFCLVHRSLKDRFVAAKAVQLAASGQPVEIAKLTLQDLLEMSNDGNDGTPYRSYGELARKAVAFVCVERTLADAKEAMDAVKSCQDVFVTRTGSPDEPVLGWLTNVEFAKAAETFS